MKHEDRRDLFEVWAKNYDQSVLNEDEFPFAGYEKVLDTIFQIAAPLPDQAILDLGIGTGNLADRFQKAGCKIWGVDFSRNMLEAAGEKLPEAQLILADLNSEFHSLLPNSYSRIVSAYTIHEFNLQTKLKIITDLAKNSLEKGGYFVIGDISFQLVSDRKRAQEIWNDEWDHSEYYWAADEAQEAFCDAGFSLNYWQVSSCGGVYQIYK
jgi:putative AdoMet-dependent methyltransferase